MRVKAEFDGSTMTAFIEGDISHKSNFEIRENKHFQDDARIEKDKSSKGAAKKQTKVFSDIFQRQNKNS